MGRPLIMLIFRRGNQRLPRWVRAPMLARLKEGAILNVKVTTFSRAPSLMTAVFQAGAAAVTVGQAL